MMVDPKSHINTGITDSTGNIFNTEAETCRLVTWPSSPPGTRGPAARAATASMAGLRSPMAAPRMSLTATQLALSITIDWAFSHRCVSREGDTASSNSFLLTATSFLLEEGKKQYVSAFEWCISSFFFIVHLTLLIQMLYTFIEKLTFSHLTYLCALPSPFSSTWMISGRRCAGSLGLRR